MTITEAMTLYVWLGAALLVSVLAAVDLRQRAVRAEERVRQLEQTLVGMLRRDVAAQDAATAAPASPAVRA
jgi:hypothetical protein